MKMKLFWYLNRKIKTVILTVHKLPTTQYDDVTNALTGYFMSKAIEELNKFKPASKGFEFRQFPFYWVMRLSNRYSHKLEKAIKKAGINITAWRVGMILRENGELSMSDIATHAVARLPTITKTVYKLQEQGLVIVKPSPEDARVSMVTITPAGIASVESVINDTAKIFDNAFDDMSVKELDTLNQLLQKVFTNLSDD